MVKYVRLFALILGFLPFSMEAALAGSFTASVDRTQLAPGESLTLELSLSGASPNGSPDLGPLEEAFTTYSQGRSQQTTIINNSITSSINWQLVLIPKKSGDIKIPALSIQTDDGPLQSQPIDISVTKSAGLSQEGTTGDAALIVTTNVNNAHPYQNEPVLFTVKLIARKSVSDVSVPEFNVEGAIVKKQGDAKVYDEVLQGERVKAIEVRYLITPMQSGTVNIPAYVFQGQVESDRQPSDFFGRRMRDSGIFDDLGKFPGFSSFVPFVVSGQEITLDVKPPAAQMDPWLPLRSLEISDVLQNPEDAKVGEPLTRKIKLVAQGTLGANLPDLESRIAPDGSFRIYADKPVTGESFNKDSNTITGWREESYSLIPQKSGKFTLPEIKVAWWDVTNNKISYATSPAITVNVMPGLSGDGDKKETVSSSSAQKSEGAKINERDPSSLPTERVVGEGTARTVLYAILAALSLAVIILACAVYYLFRKLSTQKTERPDTRDKSTGNPYAGANRYKLSAGELGKCKTPEELRSFLQTYASRHWETPQNATFQIMLSILRKRGVQTDALEIERVFSDLDTALYAGGNFDIEVIKQRLRDILKAVDRTIAKPEGQKEKLGNLNPT